MRIGSPPARNRSLEGGKQPESKRGGKQGEPRPVNFHPPLASGRLIKRYKRFLADIELADSSVLTVHCPNTGSMKNCARPGSQVWFSRSDNPKRKYPNTFELVEVGPGEIAGINTGRANALVKEAIEGDVVTELSGYGSLRGEVRYGREKSRIDFLLGDHPRLPGQDCYVEVKNVTLGMGDGLGLFPDAVTARGTRHLRELRQIRAEGHRAVLFFCVQHTGVEEVAPAEAIDPDYAAALREAVAGGVEVLAYRARITPEEVTLTYRVPVILQGR